MSSLVSDFGRLVCCGLAMMIPVLGQGQSVLQAVQPEGLLSGRAPGDQLNPGVSLGPEGGYVVWQDNAAGPRGGIMARHLDANGLPVGMPFQVNAAGQAVQQMPRVAVLPGGGAAFVWEAGAVGFPAVYARFMSAAGAFSKSGDIQVSKPLAAQTQRATVALRVIRNNRPVLQRFRVDRTVAERRDLHTGVAAVPLADGSVLVGYSAYLRQTTNQPVALPRVRMSGSALVTNSILVMQQTGRDFMQDIYFRRYTPTGEPIGPEVRVNEETRFNQRSPSFAALANGNFVVVWISENQGVPDSVIAQGLTRLDVYARIFNSQGLPLGGEIRLTDEAARDCGSPSVAGLAAGGFRVAWMQGSGTRVDGYDIVTRTFDNYGAPAGPVTRANTTTRGDQINPRVASAGAGELVVWVSLNQEGTGESVYGRWLSGGAAVGSEFRVNTSRLGKHYQPAVAGLPSGRVLVSWSGFNGQGLFDVFGQLYQAQ